MPISVNNSGNVVGLDIGGANLKAATSAGEALTVPFPLWRDPHALAARLSELLHRFPHDRLAVTMTGELCDCFATKREGVHAILDSVEEAAPKTPIQVWCTHGRFVNVGEARVNPWRVASANWHALATFAGRFAPQGGALLVDIGSTTTDIIPLWDGRPVLRSWTDPGRMASSELVYTGVRRTPVCAVLGSTILEELGHAVAAEFFATMHDVYVVLGMTPPEPENCGTADGRPATQEYAHARLARMCCRDVERFSLRRARRLARETFLIQRDIVSAAVTAVAARLPGPLQTIVLAGIGDYLAGAGFRRLPHGFGVISLRRKLAPATSAAACAYALAVLAEEG